MQSKLFCSVRPFAVLAGVIGLVACSRDAGTQVQPEGASFQQITAQGQRGADVPAFWVRPGYAVSLAATDLENARFLEADNAGNVYVSRPNIGDILRLKPLPNGKFGTPTKFVSGKKSAHGMDWNDGWLYFSTIADIWRAKDTNGDGVADKTEHVLTREQIAGGGGHWWRSILVTKNYIYTSVGDSGNIVDELDGPRQKIWRFTLDGKNQTQFASGLRNTEKLRLRPGTDEVWGCDHGSDNWGAAFGDQPGTNQPFTDLNPPDELNHYELGKFYGHPFIMGNRVPRMEYKDRKDLVELAAKTVPPAWSLGAHWATNGFCFLEKSGFGEDHRGDALVACHGSWNSVKKVGYRVERILFDDVTGLPYGSLCIVSTLSKSGEVLDRPVDCVELPDGSVIFSCDYTNSLYRLKKVKA